MTELEHLEAALANIEDDISVVSNLIGTHKVELSRLTNHLDGLLEQRQNLSEVINNLRKGR